MTNRTAPAFIALFLLAGCGGAESKDVPPANAAGFVPPRDVAATPMPGQTPDTPATAYVGKFPNDPVGGVLFFDRTDVSKALLEAVHDNATRAHFREIQGPGKADLCPRRQGRRSRLRRPGLQWTELGFPVRPGDKDRRGLLP